MRLTAKITIVANTPVNVATALGLDAAYPQYASRWLAQALAGATAGLVYVFDGMKPRGTAPTTGTTPVSGQITAATATAPGGSYSDTFDAEADNGGDIDLSLCWIDGAHSTDTVAVTANLRD